MAPRFLSASTISGRFRSIRAARLIGFQDRFQDEVVCAVVKMDVGVEWQIEGGRCDRSGASSRGNDFGTNK